MENFSKPSIANFGRSLFGGYCPTNVPDFVLQGMPNDDKLRQGLMSELAHAVQVKDCYIPQALNIWIVRLRETLKSNSLNHLHAVSGLQPSEPKVFSYWFFFSIQCWMSPLQRLSALSQTLISGRCR